MSRHAEPHVSQCFRGLRGALLATLAGLSACHGVQTPAPAVAPATTAPSPVAALEAPPEASATAAVRVDVARAPLCSDDRERCLSASLPLLERVLPTVARSPRDAFEALRASESPAARAWAAYLAHHEGDDATAEAMLTELDRAGVRSDLAPADVRDAGARALYLARELTEAASDASSDLVARLPCVVFEWDGEAARRAFRPAWGSTRDRLMAPFKTRCAAEALEGAMPPAARRGVLAASEAMSRALFREFPRPDDGTMWVAIEIDAREALTESLLGFTSDARERDVAMRNVVARLAAEDPRALPRVGNYRRSAEAHMTALANGICAVARARGQAVTGGQCQRQAYNAQLAAFTTWVGAIHGQ